MISAWMGGGKTLSAIALAHAWRAQRILIVCPLSVVGVWPREIEKHSTEPWTIARLDQGSVHAKTMHARSHCEVARAIGTAGVPDINLVVVVNHESLWREPFATFVKETKWDLLIVDECHRAKSPGGKLSRFLYQLSKRVPRRLALSGTPLPHSPADIYGQARFLNPEVYGTSFHRFKNRYAVKGGYQNYQIVGWKNTDEFERKFHSIVYEVTKEEVLADLPKEVDEDRWCRLEPKAQRIYDSLDRHFWAGVEKGEVSATNALVKLLRLQQVTSGWIPLEGEEQLEQVSHAKVDALKDLLMDILTTEPVVVFGRFHSDLDAVRDVAKKLDRRYAEISGRIKDGLTSDATMSKDVDLLGVQIQSGGVGIDLSRSCYGVFFSTGFSLGDVLQARSRLYRPGQNRPTTFIHILCEDTIDVRICEALRARENIIESILRYGGQRKGSKE